MSNRILLHIEISAILENHRNSWMTTRELADLVNARGHYLKRDGTPVTAYQVHGRTKNYVRIFERDGARVRLRLAP